MEGCAACEQTELGRLDEAFDRIFDWMEANGMDPSPAWDSLVDARILMHSELKRREE